MCSISRRPSNSAALLFCFHVLIAGIAIAGCTEHTPASAPDSLTIRLQCSSSCALDLRVDDGHVSVARDDFARSNCSVYAGNSQVTIDCRANLSQWTANQNPRREYPATPIPTS